MEVLTEAAIMVQVHIMDRVIMVAVAIMEIKQAALRYLDFRIRDIDFEKQGIIAKEKLIKELAEVAGRINDITRRELFIGGPALTGIPQGSEMVARVVTHTSIEPDPPDRLHSKKSDRPSAEMLGSHS